MENSGNYRVTPVEATSKLMMPETFDFWLAVFLFLWISSSEQAEGTGFEIKKTSCPDVCICKNDRVKCVNKSLNAVPSNLPNSTVYLDISQNKHIHIPATFFSKFSNLRHLLVKDCELERHFDSPKKLMRIDISNNKLSLQEFLLMFSKPSRFLRFIDAHLNHIEIKERISILGNASSVIKLTLDRGNHMPILYKETFKGLSNLRFLKIGAMAIEQIEDNAFEDLVKLEKLDGSGNKLISLPSNLFKPLKNLVDLDLSECQLRNFPNLTGLPKRVFKIYLRRNNIENISGMEYMGIKSIGSLFLGHNYIRELPANVFQQIAAYSLDLSYNKLQSIEPDSFTACKGFLSVLVLCYNNLADISSGAFRGLTFLTTLYLFGNKIGTVHMNAFKDIAVENLFLYNNSISHLPDIWTPMKKPPSKVLLFNNPLTHFSGITVGGIKIFLSCNKLQKLSGPIHLNSSITCLPSESFTFELPNGHEWREFAANSGFVCTPYGAHIESTCKPCPPGYFLAQEDESCTKCPPGAFYQDLVAQLQCKRCPLGQYVPPENAPGKSPLECKTCPEGTRTNESAGYRACHCLSGFSRKDRFSSCVRCETKGIKCEGDYQTLAPNFWWSWDYSTACLKKYLAFVDNLNTENNNYNRNSRSFDCPMPKAHKCVSNGICLGGIRTTCRKGYTGPLCALCQRGHYKHFKSCAKCPKLWIVFFQLLGYILLFVFLCVLVNWADKLIVNLSNDEKRSVADVLLSLLKILLGFYQVLIGTVTSFSYIPWPKTLNTALRVFKYIELELIRMPSLRCVKYSWEVNAITEFWISLSLTLLVPCTIFVYYVIRIRILHKHCRTRQEFLSTSKSSKESCFRSTMIFFFSSYPITSKRIIQLLPFSCHNICFDSTSKHCLSFIKTDYSLKCLPSNEGHWLLYVVYVFMIIPFGFPVLLLLRLYLIFRVPKHQKQNVIDRYVAINADVNDLGENDAHIYWLDENENRQAREDVISNTSTHLSFRFLYENYKPSCWYWEVIEMYRKLFLTAVLPILASESKILLAVTIILSSLFAVLHAYAKPIKNNFENYLQLVSLTVIPINLCIGYMLETMATENTVTTSQAKEHLGIGMLLLILNSFLILVMLARLIEVQIKKMKLLLNEGQCSCRCCIACVLPCVSGRSTVLI